MPGTHMDGTLPNGGFYVARAVASPEWRASRPELTVEAEAGDVLLYSHGTCEWPDVVQLARAFQSWLHHTCEGVVCGHSHGRGHTAVSTDHAFAGMPDATKPRLALLSGYSRSWLFKGWAGAQAPPSMARPTVDVLGRAGADAEALFGLDAKLGAYGSTKLDMSSFSKTAPSNDADRGKSFREEVGAAGGGHERAAALLRIVGGDVEEAMRLLCHAAKL